MNLEEAANIASEFIYSIDNLPNEVQFLLSEIRVKDTRAQEIQQEIDRDSAKYVRSGISSPSSSSSSSSSTIAASSPIISRAGSPKPNAASVATAASSAPAKIAASYAEIQQLCDEKCALAQRLIELINRTRARLEHDLAKVRVLQGEPVDYTGTATSGIGLGLTSGVGGLGVIGAAGGVGKLNGTPMIGSAAVAGGAGLAGVDGALGRNPALQLSESIRSALRASPSVNAAESASAGGTGSATKRRRLGTSASIKLTTPSRRRSASPATTVTTTTHTHQRSRLSRQVMPPEESEEEAEGEENAEEMEDVDADDDDKIYCFCRKKSFGDMIACDNEGNCPYEWFHLSCVGLKQPPPETWYCSVCSANMTKGGSGSTRKGRKK
ncbi:hypothetical protein M378DRAFT_9674 [Amanita muscaria Koide BX008]|uniref:Chromatin modification-related protein n=1 Tax=Amanita muscaria (strain Koide BX008) TaxID=946122 RepID=A0A0C2XDQ0_AMAMK|nr:hypothetical protein M378DRAFT_9674 [Amanita muscaria Koide BX008]